MACSRTLLALVESPDHVCARYRLASYRRQLQEAGWSIEFVSLGWSGTGVVVNLGRIAAADVVLLQRRLLPWALRRLLRTAARRLIFDIDDAVYCRDSNSKKPPHSGWRWRTFRSTMGMADAVTVGNRFLQQTARNWTASASVHYLPTCVQPEDYFPAVHYRREEDVRLVWIGSASTVRSLKWAQHCLAAAGSQLPGLRLEVICDQFPRVSGVAVTPHLWDAQREAADLSRGDIGISWLPEHPWSLGKCGLKVLQYMAAGLPVVANPVGIHQELVEHGRTGYLADTPAEWAEAMRRLAGSPALRAEMGTAGREKIAEYYCNTRWASRLVAILECLVHGRNRPSKGLPSPTRPTAPQRTPKLTCLVANHG